MGLLNQYTADRSNIVHVPQQHIPTLNEDAEMVAQVTDVVDITVEELSTVVNLPPEQDPFIIYLEDYIHSLVFIVDKIDSIKASEKTLRKRIRDAVKLLQSLKGAVPAENAVETIEVSVPTTTNPTLENSVSIPGTSNLADFN